MILVCSGGIDTRRCLGSRNSGPSLDHHRLLPVKCCVDRHVRNPLWFSSAVTVILTAVRRGTVAVQAAFLDAGKRIQE